MKEAQPRTIRLSDYQPPQYLIQRVDLRFDLRETGTRVESRLAMRRNPAHAGPCPELLLHGEGLNPIYVRMDGEELSADSYRIDSEGLWLRAPPDHFVLETEVEIAPEENTALEGLYRSTGMFCTQCEAEGFRRITWFLDRPDVMARFTTRIEADATHFPVLLGNGNPIESGHLPEARHYAVWDDPFPKPCYLFALVAGDLRAVSDRFLTRSGREIALHIHVAEKDVGRCEHAMRSLQAAMDWDERVYGREYDLDVFNIVAVDDFNMGAMENKGLNIFNAKYVLASTDTATDTDYAGIEGVVAHEYFHNWSGNRVTCRDWFQLSLKEGFTVFRDQEFSADMGSRGVKRIEDARMLRTHQFAEDAGPMAHPVRPDSYVEINNFYTLTVYEKGAELVRMLAHLLGPTDFRSATDLYFDRHDGQAVTTEDFVRCMEEASGRDLSEFQRWYRYAGTPRVLVQGHFDAAQGRYRLEMTQQLPDTPGQHDKPPLHIPIAMGLLDREGRELTDRVLELREPRQTFVFEGISEQPVPSLLRGMSAPVLLEYDYADQDLLLLAGHDSDGYVRWDAMQRLAERYILGRIGGEARDAESILQAIGLVLARADQDPALAAELLQLPAESWLGEQIAPVPVEQIAATRLALKQAVAERHQPQLRRLHERAQQAAPDDLSAVAMGWRAAGNLALDYLRELADGAPLIAAQYRAGRNMTEILAALRCAADSDIPEREQILSHFAQRWSSEPLVMDKWLMVQAVSRRTDTLQRVQALLEHPAFSISNPNRIRALIGSFANLNHLRFHSADGAGYEFLAEQVMRIDERNPQIAARLLRAMARWRHFDVGRAEAMRRRLEAVLRKPGLSRDSYEVASKSLEAKA